MKKMLLLFVLAILCTLVGCHMHICYNDCLYNKSSNVESSFEINSTDEQGSTLDNPIPFGEYGQIGDDSQDIQMKINKIYYETRYEYSSEKVMVVEFQINAIDLKGKNFYANSASLVLKNGTESSQYGSVEFNGTKNLSTIKFVTEGSVSAHSLFEPIDLSECLCLYYYNSKTSNYIYFALG